MEDYIEKLIEVRANPRKMRSEYLEKVGLLSLIHELVPNDFNNREKMDIIISGKYNKCYCGELSKPTSPWCSITCKNKDPISRAKVSLANTANSSDRLDKARATRMSKYGVSEILDIPEVKFGMKIKKQLYYDKVFEETFEKYNLDKVLLSNIDYLTNICKDSYLFEVRDNHFGGMPITTLTRHFDRIGFDPGFTRGSSSHGEQELFHWVSSITDLEVINNHRKTLGKEIDVYIPEKKFGIEYHGLYWHSDAWLNTRDIDYKNIHLNKLNLANEHGITLLQFYEDEWFNKKDIVKSIIKAKLGMFDSIVYARKTTIGKVDKATSDKFLDENHLQGKCVGKPIGLYLGGDLVAMMVVGKSRFDKTYELIRFVSKLNTKVIGGFSKLLKYAKIELNIETITTYADLRYSSGVTYNKFGKFLKRTPPGYFWVNLSKNIRINRFRTQKHKLNKFLGDKFDPNKTEVQNMEEAGYCKIYDCGNLSYII